jgi:transposase-like protein
MMGTMDVMPLSTSEVEVMAKPTRRRYSAEYKLRMLREVEACSRPGEIGALLRREGLYSSNLTAWRKQREKGELEGLGQKRRGPLPKENNPLADKVKALERETARLRARAERAEGLVELQKKVSEILGIELKHNGEKD